MPRKRKSTNKQSHSDKGSKGGLDSVKKTTEKAYESTKEGVESVVEGIKKAFD